MGPLYLWFRSNRPRYRVGQCVRFAAGACATGPGTTHNGMCYKPMIGATDFENGKEDCEQESGHMVTYHSQDKLDFLLTLKG